MKIQAIKGCYTLIIELDFQTIIPIGKLREYSFIPGYYAYVGSALNSLDQRIKRHLRQVKKLHWHIDYLLQNAGVCDVIYAETNENRECLVSDAIMKSLKPVPDFGCSDCHCITHLFYHEDRDTLQKVVLAGFGNAGLSPCKNSY